MKIFKTILRGFLFSGLLFFLQTTPAQANAAPEEAPTSPVNLCLPGVYMEETDECTVLGPSAYLTDIARIWHEIETQPERFPTISDSYGQTDIGYFEVNDKNNAYFSTYENAADNTNAAGKLYKGYTFAAYMNTAAAGNQTLYQLTNGNWMRGSAVARHAPPNRFTGVTPVDEITRPFGWILKDTPTLKSPGYYEPVTGNVFPKYAFVEIFDQQTIGKSEWYMIAPNEWIHMTQVALVYPAPQEEKPDGWQTSRWIEINLWEQTLSIYENNQLVYATLITTGSGATYTRPGLFKVYEKLESTPMAANINDEEEAYFLMDVPWTMYFDDRRALHAEYWHDHLGYKSSHGCVNLSFPDAEWMFDWADLGDWVFVWDPSGLTPVEPRLFTQHLD